MRSFARGFLVPALTVALAVSASGHGQAQGLTNNAPVLEELVRELSSESRSVRFRAEQQLIERGESALVALPDPRGIQDTALQEALLRVRRQIAANAAAMILDAEDLVVPSTATTCADVIALLNDRAGGRIEIGQIDELLALTAWAGDVRQGQFLQLLDKATHSAKADWRWIPGTRRIELTRLPPQHVSIQRVEPVYSRGCRVRILELREQRNFVDPERRKLLRAVFAVDVEPRLRAFWFTVADGNFEFESGETAWPLLNPLARREITPNGGRFQFPIDFSVPVDEPTGDIDLSGAAVMRVAVRPVEVSLREGDMESQRVGDMELKLLEWEAGDQLRVKIEARFDAPLPELESHRQGLLHQDIVLRSADGKDWLPRSIELLSADGLQHVVEYAFPAGITVVDGAVVYLAPTLLTDSTVAFEFAGIKRSMFSP